ncbi:hypothetical protein K491DRAFT_757246 [Lophiostoma macrostomum CBS 122681]|uniref:Rhodopsin domain-containing protein n=1 Tax=Lophiostoma macrostomum CBS 122681 TaxID=1314788 RepID=A0A6A6TDI2_9PLEO|nr:hypothetical protein K491DRAFT_757246 [Lophiostoma macrostomum CBS 122681]
MVSSFPVNGSPALSMIITPPIFLAIATVVLFFRFWARKEKKQNWGVDDYLCATALFITYGGYASLVVSVVWGGVGRSIYTLPFENMELALKALNSVSQTWGAAVACVQLSILFLYLRVFHVVIWFTWTCYVLIGLVITWWISYFISIMVACVPLRAFWTPGVPSTCIDMKKFAIASTASHILLDVLLVLLVIPIIWRLKTSLRNRVTVAVALTLAIFATICAILRFAFRLDKWNDPDATGVGWIGSLLDVLENASAVICCSLPIMAFLLGRLAETRFGSSVKRLFSTSYSRKSSVKSKPSNNSLGREKGPTYVETGVSPVSDVSRQEDGTE